MAMIGIVLQAFVIAAWVLVLGRVLISWVDPTFSKPLGRFLYKYTEPVLSPIRNALPRTGRLDLSPLVVLIALGVLMRFV